VWFHTDVFAGLLPLLTGNWALCGSVDDVFSSRGLYLPWRYPGCGPEWRYLPLWNVECSDHELVGRIPSGELAALPTAFAVAVLTTTYLCMSVRRIADSVGFVCQWNRDCLAH